MRNVSFVNEENKINDTDHYSVFLHIQRGSNLSNLLNLDIAFK